MLLKKMGLYSEAKDHLEQASSNPALGFSITALADVYLELGDEIRAEEVLEKFPGSKQRNSSYLATKANVLRRKGDYKGAEVLLKKAIYLQPNNIVLFGGLAQTKLEETQSFARMGDKQSALICIEEAKNTLSKGLIIEKDNELLLSLSHMISKVELSLKT